MSGIQVKVKFKKAKAIAERVARDLLSPEFVKEVQEKIVNGEIKRLIASGQSPVQGFGRFAQYKDSDKYPGKQKSRSPVNLNLTGKLLSEYKTTRKNNTTLAVGIASGSGDKLTTIAKANNEGTFDLKGLKITKKLREAIREQNPSLPRNRRTSVRGVVSKTKGTPSRRFVPIKEESFTESVIRKIKNLYATRIKALVSKT